MKGYPVAEHILQIRELQKYFMVPKPFSFKRVFKKVEHETVKAVDGVSFDVFSRETLGLVGESGCGKTTIGRLILRAIDPTGGTIRFGDKAIEKLDGDGLMEFRKQVQVVFQDPFLSLNPRKSTRKIISEPLLVHHMVPRDESEDRVVELMELVGLDPNLRTLYPYELSTGQRKRIAIARAIATNPTLLIADEASSGLDVSVKAQVLNLMANLQDTLALTYIFISHDLGVVQYVAHKVAIMYLGKIVEFGDTKTIFDKPLHPYSVALLGSIPKVRAIGEVRTPITSPLKGEIPSPIDLPQGCRFQERCPKRMDKCFESEPELVEIDEGHKVSCYLYN